MWETVNKPQYKDDYDYIVLATIEENNQIFVKAVCPVFDRKRLIFYGDPVTNEAYGLNQVKAWCYLPEPYIGE